LLRELLGWVFLGPKYGWDKPLGLNKTIVYAVAALITAGLLAGGVAYWKHSIRVAEQRRILQEQEADAAKKSLEAEKDAQKKEALLRSLAPDELAEYFRSGKLPDRTRKDRHAPSP
jgi:hypothetical protein